MTKMSEAIQSIGLVNFNHEYTQNEALITRVYKVRFNSEYVFSQDTLYSDSFGLFGDMSCIDSEFIPKVGDVIPVDFLPETYKGAYFRCIRVHPFLEMKNEALSMYVECVFQCEGINYAWMIEENQKCHLIDFSRDTSDYEFQTDKAFAGNDSFGMDSSDNENNKANVPIINSAGDQILDGIRMVKPITTFRLTYMSPTEYFDESILDLYNYSINTNEIKIAGLTISQHAGFMVVKDKVILNAHNRARAGLMKFTLEIRVKQGNAGLSEWGNLNPPDTWDAWPIDQGFRIRNTSDQLIDITKGMVKTGVIAETTPTDSINDPVKLKNGGIHPSVYDTSQENKAIWLYYRVQRQYSWGVDGKIVLPFRVLVSILLKRPSVLLSC